MQLITNSKMDQQKEGKINMFNKINISSININGLNNKLTSIQHLMQNNFMDIMCIQETHKINKLNLKKWAKIHNYTVYTNQEYDTPKLKHVKEGTTIIISKKLEILLQLKRN